ncbi:hypothetical protein GCM10009794_16210 [Rothia terrae]
MLSQGIVDICVLHTGKHGNAKSTEHKRCRKYAKGMSHSKEHFGDSIENKTSEDYPASIYSVRYEAGGNLSSQYATEQNTF